MTHDPFVIIRAAQMAAYTSLAVIMALKRAEMARLRLQLRRSSCLGIVIVEVRRTLKGWAGWWGQKLEDLARHSMFHQSDRHAPFGAFA